MSNEVDKGKAKSRGEDFRLDELLRKLKSGELPGGGEGYKVFYIKSTSELQGDFSFGPGGHPEIGFGQKFEKGFTGWEHGERVKSSFKVVKKSADDSKRVYGLQVSESVVGDIRHADTFILDGLTPEDEATLNGIGIAEIEAVVEVNQRVNTKYQISNMQDYSARLDRVIAFQKPWDGNTEELKDKQPVLLEGVVVSYKQNREYPYDGATVVLKTENGRTVPVKLWNGYLDIEDGVIERFSPKHPVTGDVVQVNTTYGNPQARYGRDEEPCFFAYFCRSTYLLTPEQNRKSSYEEQRKRVASKIDEAERKDDPKQIRGDISSIIHTSITEEGDLNLTGSEKAKINQLIDRKFSEAKEKPIVLFEDFWGMEDVRRGYGLDVYGVSRGEFYDFCMQVASGERKMIADGSPDSPWRLIQGNLSPEEYERVLALAIDTLSQKVIGKKRIMREPILANPDNVTWEDQYLLGQSLKYYDDCLTPGAAKRYVGLVNLMNERSLFMRTDEDRLREFCEYEIVDSMTSNITNNIIWKGDEWGTEIVGLKRVDAIRPYLSQVKMLEDLRDRLRIEGWTNRGSRRPEQYVEKLLGFLEMIDGYLKQSKGHLN